MNKEYYDKVYKYYDSIKKVSKNEVTPIWIMIKESDNECSESPSKIYEYFR